jgi:hypothetical protein
MSRDSDGKVVVSMGEKLVAGAASHPSLTDGDANMCPISAR